jgi:uncharacterized protein YceH (UPF0502 family)
MRGFYRGHALPAGAAGWHAEGVPLLLSPIEARVLGCLIEKDLATPEYYPLSLNSLTNACNQKTNREPVVQYDDATTRAGLAGLRELGLVTFVAEAGSRVEKYRHRLSERFNFPRGELALLAVLQLRGPQTVAELRERCQRMYAFEDSAGVETALERLAAREPDPLTRLLPRLPGTKEPRWAHLLCGEPVLPAAETAAPSLAHALGERLEELEAGLAEVRRELAELRAGWEDFRRQLE